MLSKLPVHLLAFILAGEYSYLVVDLYKCGNNLLNYKLANGGCVEVHLIDNSFGTTSRYPKMLSTLRYLRSLQIYRDNAIILPLEELSIEIMKLSNRLEVLILSCENSVSAFIQHDPESLSPTGICDFKSHFTSLRMLKFEDYEKGLDEESLAHLPPSLISLTLPTIKWDESNDTAILPPNLEELVLTRRIRGRATNKHSQLKKLPSSLRVLSGISILSSWTLTLSLVSLLPRTLEILDEWDCFLSWTPELDALPPSLTKLCLSQLSNGRPTLVQVMANINAALPNLKDLEINNADTASWDYELISLLPRSLTHLQASIRWDTEASENRPPAAWPIALTSLIDRFGTPTNLPLPHGLTRYGGSFVSMPTDDSLVSFDLLPKVLKDLTIISQVGTLLAPGIPSSVTRLAVQKKLILKRLDYLPPTLISLTGKLAIKSNAETSTLELPSNLEELAVAEMPIKLFKRLPSSLTSLSIGTIDASEAETISFSSLPSGLTSLKVSKRCNAALVDVKLAFANLTSLKHLALHNCFCFPGRVLRNLARNISTLSIQLTALKARHLQALPDNLNEMELGPALIGDLASFVPVCVTMPEEWSWDDKSVLGDRFTEAVDRSYKCPDPRVLARYATTE